MQSKSYYSDSAEKNHDAKGSGSGRAVRVNDSDVFDLKNSGQDTTNSDIDRN